MSQEFFALLMAAGAGLSTVLGSFIIFSKKTQSNKVISFALAFAAGAMVSVSLIEFYPESVRLFEEGLDVKNGTVFTIISLTFGVIIAYAIDRFVPHDDTQSQEHKHVNLMHVGFVSMVAMLLHNFPEGIATYMSAYSDATLGISVAIAIGMHNIPEGITVALPVFIATKSKRKAIWYTFLSGVSEPIGALLAFTLLRPFLNDVLLATVFGIVGGIMIYISLEELYPSSREYGYTKMALLALFLGICFIPLTAAIG
ncbi:MAG: zinc transporter ZupT [Erysipelotrichaceae bacterium]|nr:zinc transporter ZupT [Erysipelotrichaceae bacterium]